MAKRRGTSDRTRRHLKKAVSVETILGRAVRLKPADRLLIVEQALTLLEGFYVHPPGRIY